MRTQVGIVGAGPAGLMLSHLLHLEGIDSVVVDKRTREDIEQTIKAGILEHGTVQLMHETGIGERLKRDGQEHRGIYLRFEGRNHRIDLHELTGGKSVTVYAQHEVLIDLIARRLADGGRVHFGVDGVSCRGLTGGDTPAMSFTDEQGVHQELTCDFIAGCDGSRTYTRFLIPEGGVRRDFFHQYPFAWFGILAKAPPSSDELIYSRHERGFALISTRSPSVQRLYFQCDPADSVDNWSDDRIWDELHRRVDGEDAGIVEGEIFQKGILHFRSLVVEPMQYGRLFLAGDSAHTVPPTGAKGMNLAIADVVVLARAMAHWFGKGERDLLDVYTDTVLQRVWRAQQFSYWMTSMLHRFPDATEFALRRQVAELEGVTATAAGAAYVAENYVGLPFA
jgi:p-hydroxybenzoate 3-monooxygenase